VLTPVVGLGVGALAVVFAEISGKSYSYVLFSGQSALAPLIEHAGTWTVGALVLLIVCKGLAYAGCLNSFRGGVDLRGHAHRRGAGIALSHLPGLPMIAGAAMGIGTMTTVMLTLPLTSVLLTPLFLTSDGVALMPLTIVAVVVAYVASTRLEPAPGPARGAAPTPSSAPSAPT
jgi:chloride channel protein, CIC family